MDSSQNAKLTLMFKTKVPRLFAEALFEGFINPILTYAVQQEQFQVQHLV